MAREGKRVRFQSLLVGLLLLSFGDTALPVKALAAEKLPRVAVLEFDSKGDLEIKDAGSIIAERLITALSNLGTFDIVERVLLKKILEEQSLQMTGAIDTKTAVEIGKIYGVERIISGSVSKWSNSIQIDARVVSTQDGSVIKAASVEAFDVKDVPRQITQLAQRIAGKGEPKEPVSSRPPPPPPSPPEVSLPQDTSRYPILSMEYDIDRRGMDYRAFTLPSPDPRLCQNECAGDPKCRAYTYVRPGVQGPQARCWLKSSVPAPYGNACCVSGVKTP